MKIVYTDYRSPNDLLFQRVQIFGEPPVWLSEQTQDACELYLFLSGNASYSIHNVQYSVKNGDVVVLPPKTAYTWQTAKNASCEYIRWRFNPLLLPALQDVDICSFYQRAATYAYVLPRSLVKDASVTQQLLTLEELCKTRHEYTDLHCIRVTLRLADTLNQIALESIDKRILSLRSTKNNAAYLCMRYINDHLHEKLSIDALSKSLSISPSHLQAVFKKDTGISLHKYVFLQKMQFANKLLQQGFSAQVVAQKLGYEYYATFYQAYKKIYNNAPTNSTSK